MRLERIAVAGAALALLAFPAAAQTVTPTYPPMKIDCPSDARPYCRIRGEADVAQLQRRLGGERLAYWTEGQDLHFVARGFDTPTFCCTIQLPMARVGETDLWVISLRIPRLDEAVIELGVYDKAMTPTFAGVHRGTKAPPPPETAERLAGRLESFELASRILPKPRRVSIYDPPARYGRPRAVVYFADDFAEPFAKVIEPLIARGELPPVRLVGIERWNLEPGASHRVRSAGRLGEYVRGRDAEAMARHNRWVVEEVMPRAEAGLPKRGLKRFTAGTSAGGAWAFTMAAERPDLFAGAFPMSPAIENAGFGDLKPSPSQAYYVIEGLFEGVNGRGVHDHLAAHRTRACYMLGVDGHSHTLWQAAFPKALKAALTPGSACPRWGKAQLRSLSIRSS